MITQYMYHGVGMITQYMFHGVGKTISEAGVSLSLRLFVNNFE